MENSSLYGLIQQTAKGGDRGDRSERMSKSQKDVVKIVYSAGLSVRQAVELLNMPPHTVRYHYRDFRGQEVPVVSLHDQAVALLEHLSEGGVEYEGQTATAGNVY